MSAKHTPGPLSATRISTSALIHDSSGICIGEAFMRGSETPDPLANAILWAAAPELLDALKEVQWCEGGYCPQCARELNEGHQEKCFVGNAIAKTEVQP
jgi:hypothetical protein